MRPRLAVTLGDPRGIGPEIVAALRADPLVASATDLVIVGPSGTGVPVDHDVGPWIASQSVAERRPTGGASH